MFENLKEDARTYSQLGGWIGKLGFWCVATYRFGVWARSLPPVARTPFVVQHRLLDTAWRLACAVQIADSAEIGPGFCLIHPRNVFVPPTKIGKNCLIFHEVTIGANVQNARYPRIGDDVKIHVGARVLGDITIGNGARIGANCVVTSSLPASAVVTTASNRMAHP